MSCSSDREQGYPVARAYVWWLELAVKCLAGLPGTNAPPPLLSSCVDGAATTSLRCQLAACRTAACRRPPRIALGWGRTSPTSQNKVFPPRHCSATHTSLHASPSLKSFCRIYRRGSSRLRARQLHPPLPPPRRWLLCVPVALCRRHHERPFHWACRGGLCARHHWRRNVLCVCTCSAPRLRDRRRVPRSRPSPRSRALPCAPAGCRGGATGCGCVCTRPLGSWRLRLCGWGALAAEAGGRVLGGLRRRSSQHRGSASRGGSLARVNGARLGVSGGPFARCGVECGAVLVELIGLRPRRETGALKTPARMNSRGAGARRIGDAGIDSERSRFQSRGRHRGSGRSGGRGSSSSLRKQKRKSFFSV